MAGNLTLDTAQVMAVAAEMRSLNNELEQVLTDTKNKVNSLSGSWSGAASEAAIGAYNAFAQKYFSNYKELIESYAKFLETNVSADYEAVEKANAEAAKLLE